MTRARDTSTNGSHAQALRASTKPDHEVLIIGTGFSGLGMAIQLQKAGFHDTRSSRAT